MHNTNKKLISLCFICIVAILMSLSTKKGILIIYVGII
jgi:hypothetical protein